DQHPDVLTSSPGPAPTWWGRGRRRLRPVSHDSGGGTVRGRKRTDPPRREAEMSETPDSESYGEYSVDDEDQPQGDGDSLVDNRGLREPLDEGYSPPEKWSAAQGYGNTPR